MVDGLRAVGRGLRSVQTAGYAYIWANLAFVVLSLPLVTLPAAWSALVRVAYQAQTHPAEADLALFWGAFRANLLRALPWGLLNALFAVINFGNLAAYADAPGIGAALLRGVWILAGLIWLGALLYTWPLFYEMAEPSISGAVRNALIMVLRNSGYTLTLIFAIAVLALISTALIAAWALLTWGAIAAIATAAVLDRLAQAQSA